MKKPLVAVVGRPNVGKSTFFNKICGKRISIVDDTPGVTRDRIYADAEWCGYNFRMVDTGGLDSKSGDVFQGEIKEQADIAIDLADVIVFIVDGKTGLTQNDSEVGEYLRKSGKPVVLVVNKLDNFEVENSYEFYSLGLGEPYPISCEQSKGLGEVLDAIVANFNERNYLEEETGTIKIAIVGKPNVGKSSITNRVLGEDRVVVSDVAGTTRDAIETDFKCNGKKYTLIDTAGLRRQRGVEHESVEGYSVIRSMEAIKRADVVLIVMDASEPISEQDVRIAGYVHEEGKPSIVVMNKWDKVDKDGSTINAYTKELQNKLSFMDYFVPVFTSAVTGKRLLEVIEKVDYVYQNATRRITTGALNDLLASAILSNEPPYRNGRKLKIQYVTQVQVAPPTFVLFVNDATLMHFSYLRYLENRFRDAVDFKGTPIKFITRSKTDKKE
ncbi:MAG: ribosome biogenesis GTPase Der [Clostridiales bacterium]|nr:ribosome biogenesis GTPase Der [Clostridiales bacterium]